MNKIQAEDTTNTSLPVGVGAVSELGLRDENQDNMTGFASPLGSIYLIADGMGGYRGGAEASRMVTEGFRRKLMSASADENYWEALARTTREVNDELMAKSSSGDPQFAGMGSTIAIVLIRQINQAFELITAHAGDSRVYVSRGGVLTLLTKDHTRVQWLVDNQALDEAAARDHPDASVLTRAFGHTVDLTLNISQPVPLVNGDGILLCSDGLSGFVDNGQINQVIQENPDPTECAQQLVRLALTHGSNDNITVQFIRVGASPHIVARPAENRRDTLPEGRALSSAPAVAIPKSNVMRYVAGGVLLGAALAGAGLMVYREEHSPASAEKKAPVKTTSDDHLTRLNRLANAALADAQRTEKRLAEKKAKAAGSNKKQLEAEMSNLQKKRRDLERDISDLFNPPDSTKARNTEVTVQTETDELRGITGRIEKTELSTNGAVVPAKRSK